MRYNVRGGDTMATEAQRRASTAYNRRQDNIMIRPSKAEGARIRQAAANAGKSVQAYILEALRREIGYTLDDLREDAEE